MKERFEARPRLGEKALSTEDRAKLFWPRVARDSERQTLQTDPIATCQHYRPVVARASGGRHDDWNLLNWSPSSTACFNQIPRHWFSCSLEHSLLYGRRSATRTIHIEFSPFLHPLRLCALFEGENKPRVKLPPCCHVPGGASSSHHR